MDPPLGFNARQTVDLAGWLATGGPLPQTLLRAIHRLVGSTRTADAIIGSAPREEPAATVQIADGRYELAASPPEESERADIDNITWHGQVLRRIARLRGAMNQIDNTHRPLAEEFGDFAMFVGDDLATLNIAATCSALGALDEHVRVFDVYRGGSGTLTDPLEPALVVGLRALVNDATTLIGGFEKGRLYLTRARELRALDVPPAASARAAASVLRSMHDRADLLGDRFKKLVGALLRGLDDAQASSGALLTGATMTAINALIAFGRKVGPGLVAPAATVAVLDAVFKVSGDPNWELANRTARYLLDYIGNIGAFASHHDHLRTWLETIVERIRERETGAGASSTADDQARPASLSADLGGGGGVLPDLTPAPYVIGKPHRDRLKIGIDGPDMMFIPPRSFLLDNPETAAAGKQIEALLANLKTPPEASIRDGYLIGRYPVTVGEFAAFATDAKYKAKGDWEHVPFQSENRDRHPVVNVSWEDARRYVAWLGEQTGGKDYRLPHEAEWEYACRAGTTTDQYWGVKWRGGAKHALTRESSGGKGTRPVEERLPNQWGLHDMLGNVWEWMQDEYEERGLSRVLRGGSWDSDAGSARAGYRSRGDAGDRGSIVGFRLARTLF